MKTATAARRRKSTNTDKTETEAKTKSASVPVPQKKKEESTNVTNEAEAETTIARIETTKRTKSVESGPEIKNTSATDQESANAKERNAATDPTQSI